MFNKFSFLDESTFDNATIDSKFACEFMVSDVHSLEEAETFKNLLESSFGYSFSQRFAKRKNEEGVNSTYIFTVYYNCQHWTAPRSDLDGDMPRLAKRRRKGCLCTSTVHFKLKRMTKTEDRKRNERTRDFRPVYQLHVVMVYDHNHSVKTAASLGFKRVSEESKVEIEKYFDKGMNASAAQRDWRAKLIDKGVSQTMRADSSILPTLNQIRYLYSAIEKKRYGARFGPEMYQFLQNFCTNYNSSTPDGILRSIIPPPDGNLNTLVLVLITPFMRRVLKKIDRCGEMVHVDSTGSLDCNNLTVTLLITNSLVGALPIGIIVTGTKSEEAYVNGFKIYSEILPHDVKFNGLPGDALGPKIFMADDDPALRNALRRTWPSSRLLLCTFHVLQAWHRWLKDSTHGVTNQGMYSMCVCAIIV